MPPPHEFTAPHPRLQRDCHWLGTLGDCQLLLHRNASLPWFILVPPGPYRGIEQLPDTDARHVLGLVKHLSRFITDRYHSENINIASIGNLVAQLHIHVIGRRRDDGCWPLPVWGHLKDHDGYASKEIADLSLALEKQLHLTPYPSPAPP